LRRRRFLQLIAAAPMLRAAHVAGAGQPVLPHALGYLPWWMAPGWRQTPWRMLDRLVLFDAPVGDDGAVAERDWLRRAADFRGISVDLALTLMKEEQFERVFGDRAARARLLADCVRVLSEPAIGGLHLDFEGYRPVATGGVAAFRDWLAALDGKRREMGKSLSAFFPASDSFSIYGAGAAEAMDYWVAQIYDAHWKESKLTGPLVTRDEANPVAVQRALARLAALKVPPGRVLLSVPLYGWQWPSDSDRPGAAADGAARLLTFAPTPEALMPNDRLAATELARLHGLRRDREHTPYFAYRDGAQWLQGWYEDAASLTRKFGPERGRGYAGLAFFPLGYDKGEIVDAMLRWWRAEPRS
jgi:spore germination protein